MRRLWVLNNKANTVTPIDPLTGDDGARIHVDDPYNMYYTPDGKFAIVIAETDRRLDFLDPQTMRSCDRLHVEVQGHRPHRVHRRRSLRDRRRASSPGSSSRWISPTNRVVGYLDSTRDDRARESMPQDIRSSPDARVFYVADMMAERRLDHRPVSVSSLPVFIKTGVGTHGIYPSRDGRLLYVTNRGWNTITRRPARPRIGLRDRSGDERGAPPRGRFPVAAARTWAT